MNNFVFSQDPLLFQPRYSGPNPMDIDMKQQQLNNSLEQYKLLQQSMQQIQDAPPPKDHIGELDDILKGLSEAVTEELIKDPEYISTNNEIQSMIQGEIMKSVKWKLNNNPDVVKIISKQKDNVDRVKKTYETAERSNLNELNDYIKNYSNMTFDEYKKVKAGGKKHDNR